MQFGEHLAKVVAASVPCCVGIDPHMDRVPFELTGTPLQYNLYTWTSGVIDAVYDAGIRVVKPQSALFEQFGPGGVNALKATIQHARNKGMVVILDAKRGDIGSTARGYVKAAYEAMGANSVTLNPYLGPESLEPFQQYFDAQTKLKGAGQGGPGAWVLVRTSNPGAAPWQGQGTDNYDGGIAHYVANWLNKANSNVYTHEQQLSFERDNGELDELPLGDFGAVIGATLDAKEMAHWREKMPNTWFLLPGYGAQGASAADCLAGFRRDKTGGLIVSARAVLFQPKGEAEGLRDWRIGVRERAQAFADDVRGVL
jgi:orotidine-5'-phosphate decarboxylase